MTSVIANTNCGPQLEREQRALINLLGDENPSVFQAVSQRIISLGHNTQTWLKPCCLSSDPLLRRHAQNLLRHFDREVADTRFMTYCLQPEEQLDLETGAWMLAQTQYPEINPTAYRALLDDYAGELREWLALSDPQAHRLVRINEFIFTHLSFTGNMENYYDPENTFLNRVLDRRMGNPVSLCLVYTLLAQRLGLPVCGIGLPGHSLCRYLSAVEEIYIDAFNLGKLLTRNDCMDHLARCHHEGRAEYLKPMSARRMLARMCGNLEQIYLELKQADDAARVQRYLFALTR